MQLYFYDTDETIRHRIRRSPNLDEGVIMIVLQLLEDNPYVHVFRSLGNVANLDEYRIELNTDIGVDLMSSTSRFMEGGFFSSGL
jgi:hypothetical protein